MSARKNLAPRYKDQSRPSAATTGFSVADHSFWGNALRDLLAGLAAFQSPEFEELFTGFVDLARRWFNEFERFLDARRPQVRCFFQKLERIKSSAPVPGYEDFLIGEGCELFAARLMGHALHKLGETLGRERSLAGAFRAVIKVEAKSPLVAARRVDERPRIERSTALRTRTPVITP